jgi:hypothetical protein
MGRLAAGLFAQFARDANLKFLAWRSHGGESNYL